MRLRNEKRYLPGDYDNVPRKRRQISTEQDLCRARLITTQNEQSPLFTRLPRELRDMIWEYAFGSDETRFHYRNLAIVTSNPEYIYGDGDGDYDGLPTWLLLCKTILREALDVFYRTHTYAPAKSYGNSRPKLLPTGQRRCFSVKSCRGRLPPNPIERSTYKNRLLFNNNIKNVETTWCFRTTWPRTEGVYDFTPGEIPGLFVQYLQQINIKDVKVTCELQISDALCHDPEMYVYHGKKRTKDRKKLDGKMEGLRGRCRNFTVVVYSCPCSYCRDSSERVLGASATVEAWAKSIVGRDAEVQVCDGRKERDDDCEVKEFRTIRVSRPKL